jgi:hypothetical protein
VKRLGIEPAQFKNMVEEQQLFEWNAEVALDVHMRQSKLVIREDTVSEYLDSSTEEISQE